jgi:hypothetical protein
MCNVFGMAADERSSVAIECELARQAMTHFALPHKNFQQFKSSTLVFLIREWLMREARVDL